MRWLVEVTSLGRTEKDSLYVDAECWQKALQVARTLRGETDADERLLDRAARRRVPRRRSRDAHRATRCTAPRRTRGRRPPVRPRRLLDPRPRRNRDAPRGALRPAGRCARDPAGRCAVRPAGRCARGPAGRCARGPPDRAPCAGFPPAGPAAVRPARRGARLAVDPGEPPRVRSQFPPRPQISASATMMLGNPPSGGSVAPAVGVSGGASESAKGAYEPRAARSDADVRSGSVPPASRGDATTTLPSQIVFKREQDATEALPLTYREYVYVVPPGSTEMAAATLVQAQLELVRASLDRMPAGKLVNLAVFDVAFQGKPPVPPLATLTWKDWRGVALVSFPRQPGRSPLTIPTGLPPAAPLAAAFSPAPAPVAASQPPAYQPATVSAPAPAIAPAAARAGQHLRAHRRAAQRLRPRAPQRLRSRAAQRLRARAPQRLRRAPPRSSRARAANIFAPTPAPPTSSPPAGAGQHLRAHARAPDVFAPAATPAPANVFAPAQPPVFAPTPAPPFAPRASPFVPARRSRRHPPRPTVARSRRRPRPWCSRWVEFTGRT